MHNYPWYRAWNESFGKRGVTMIGIHTPETKGEAKLEGVREKVKENKFDFAIAVDNDWKIWNAWGNRAACPSKSRCKRASRETSLPRQRRNSNPT